jgi:hypothetical protein
MFAVAALVSIVCMATKIKLFCDKYRARNRSGNGGGGNDVLSIAARRQALKDFVDSNVLDQHRMYPRFSQSVTRARCACSFRCESGAFAATATSCCSSVRCAAIRVRLSFCVWACA